MRDQEQARRGSREALRPPLRSILEAVLFASDRPLSLEQMRPAVPDVDLETLRATLADMASGYEDLGAGFRLVEVADGYQLTTDPTLHEYVERFLVGKRRARLSRAALETLAAVAYRQPITRGELEDLRGVDCGQVLHTLMERNLVSIRGRSQALGRPLLYGTTDDFLSYFGLPSLSSLPSLEEFASLQSEEALEDPEIRSALVREGLWEDPEADPAGESHDLASGEHGEPELTLILGGAGASSEPNEDPEPADARVRPEEATRGSSNRDEGGASPSR